MENFIVSARKYRPSRFDDVIGQIQVTQTLKNAIRNNQLAQAFLFCGPRGVGKTTCARILAKVINCENMSPEIEACNQCNSCISFNHNASFNVHELDAASNNSVEDIRSLIEQVRYAPQSGKKKIYIIDEVHMLSNQAFNAFLKTLEEPPPYAIFILATTEKHKIIPTILSRCQIFDFNRIKTEDTAEYLKTIATKENIEAEPDALHIIAQKADGALRDALSIFDRISVFTGGKITYQSVLTNLNILDYDYYFRFTDYFLQENIADCLLSFNEILTFGFEGDNFLSGLSTHIRNLMVCKDTATLQLLETSANLKTRYAGQAAYTPVSFLLNALNIINEAEIQYRTNRNKRLCVELALMKLCYFFRVVKNIKDNQVNNEAKKKTDNPISESSLSVTPTPVNKSGRPVEKPEEKSPAFASLKNTTIKLPTLQEIKLSAELKSETHSASANSPTPEGDELDETQLNYVFSNLIEKLLKEKNNPIAEILRLYPPYLENNRNVLITVASQSHSQLLSDFRETIVRYLMDGMNKKNISLTINVDSEKIKQDVKTKPYLPNEKFEQMAKKNPTLRKLKNDFKLDIDF